MKEVDCKTTVALKEKQIRGGGDERKKEKETSHEGLWQISRECDSGGERDAIRDLSITDEEMEERCRRNQNTHEYASVNSGWSQSEMHYSRCGMCFRLR